MEKLKNIESICLSHVGRQNRVIDTINLPINISGDINLPTYYCYNGDWKMEHECNKCNALVTVEMYFKKEFPFQTYTNFSIFTNIRVPYFSLQLLKDMSKILKGVSLVQEKDDLFISDNLNIKNNFPISINISFHKCNTCGEYYLSHFYNNSAFIDERNGKTDLPQLSIVEIMNVKLEERELKELF